MNDCLEFSPMYPSDALNPRRVRTAAVQSFLIFALLAATMGSAPTPSPPTFDKIVRALTDYFKSLPDYQRADLLNQEQVTGALAALAKIGWEPTDSKEIIELALPVNSFLVGELATPDGKRFMRKISKNPGTYSRLDRLSRLSQGQQVVSQLIGDVGGDVMITYLATTNSGHNMGKMLAATPNGTDLNLPTGRIYTADDLLAALKKSYKKEFLAP
jgi:hypothetical protein